MAAKLYGTWKLIWTIVYPLRNYYRNVLTRKLTCKLCRGPYKGWTQTRQLVYHILITQGTKFGRTNVGMDSRVAGILVICYVVHCVLLLLCVNDVISDYDVGEVVASIPLFSEVCWVRFPGQVFKILKKIWGVWNLDSNVITFDVW